jgi:hypothetical protein
MAKPITKMKTTHNIAASQSAADHLSGRGIARPIFAALLIGAGMITVSWSAPARAETPKKKATYETTGKLKDNHRIYNPMTGNFEEAPPFGPRTNK